MSHLKKLATLILNTGWIVPFYLSVNAVITWCQLEASPVINGTERTLNSFPFLSFAESTLIFACVWLAVAVILNTMLQNRVARIPAV